MAAQADPIETSAAEGRGWMLTANLLTPVVVLLYATGEWARLSAASLDRSVAWPYLLGQVLGILLMPLLAVGVARLFARPYTRRTFWKAYSIGMLLCLPAALNAIGRAAASLQ